MRLLTTIHAWYKNQKRIQRFQKRYGAAIDYSVRLFVHDEENIWMEEGVVIGAGTVLHAKNVGKSISSIFIGEKTYIGEYCTLGATGGSIHIGKSCLIAQHVCIVAANHDYPKSLHEWSTKKNHVVIGDGVWLGSGVTVLPGVMIGDFAVVGAGAVVTKDVEPNTVVVGVPARPL